MAKKTPDRPATRRKALQQHFRRLEIDAFLVTNPIHVSYLTGFSGEDSYLLVTKKSTILISDTRFTDQIEEECPGLETYIRTSGKQMPAAVAEVLTSCKVSNIAYEKTGLTVAAYKALKDAAKSAQWRGTAGIIEDLRAVKDADEIEQIREAIRIAERAFAMFRLGMRPSDDEKSLADEMESYIRRQGGRCSAFPPIVAVGPRAALPHAVPTQRRIEEDDFVLIDWGARGKFYNSDLTRVLVTRKISGKFAKIYQIVLEAQERAIASIRPGVTGAEVDAVARKYIEDAGFGDNFGHGLGHGLGMQVHEAPGLRRGSEVVLKPGMVVTIEPGIYLSGWGGVRIEDDVLVTKDGCEVLTSVPKRLEEMQVG